MVYTMGGGGERAFEDEDDILDRDREDSTVDRDDPISKNDAKSKFLRRVVNAI